MTPTGRKTLSTGHNSAAKPATNDVARPQGALSEEELEEIGRAYASGSRGSLLIGLRGTERLLTMLLPAQTDAIAAKAQLFNILAKLRSLGCDGYIQVCRVLSDSPPFYDICYVHRADSLSP